ncbi:MAG: hypothetical protein V1708_01415 [Candidatus Micrarchaeota archaeon]
MGATEFELVRVKDRRIFHWRTYFEVKDLTHEVKHKMTVTLSNAGPDSFLAEVWTDRKNRDSIIFARHEFDNRGRDNFSGRRATLRAGDLKISDNAGRIIISGGEEFRREDFNRYTRSLFKKGKVKFRIPNDDEIREILIVGTPPMEAEIKKSVEMISRAILEKYCC